MTNPTLWNQILIWPITNLLIAFYKLAEYLHFPGPLGFAIIAMTLLFRIVLYPFMSTQIKSSRKMAKLKPHLDQLQKKHKEDRQALFQAQQALYKEHGVNPYGGCLPMLLQTPILIALYRVFSNFFTSTDLTKVIEEINHILYYPQLKISTLDLSFFGLNLGVKPSQWQSLGWWLLAVPVVTAALQWYQTKLMMDQQTAQKAIVPAEPEKKPKAKNAADAKKDTKEELSAEDSMMEMQKNTMLVFPLLIGGLAYQFSIGLALYWNLSGIFGIIQQLYINKKDK